MSRLALRLASFKDLLASDLQGTLGRISESGFRAVEVTHMLGDSDRHFSEALDAAGLRPVSRHVHLHDLRARLARNPVELCSLAVTYIVVPIVQLDEYGSGWERLGSELGALASVVAGQGPQLVFQPNHAEFRPDRGRTGMDFLVEAAGSALRYELDLKILMDSKADPQSVLQTSGAKAPLVVLDFGDSEPTPDHPVNQAWRAYSPVALQSGLDWIVACELAGTGDRFEKLHRIRTALQEDHVVA